MTLYRMHDSEPAGMIQVDLADAAEWNAKGYGIFTTVNAFDGPRRIENCTRIRAWAIDLDSGTKAEQQVRIEKAPLFPSVVVETKSGFHVYWYAEDGRPEQYRPLVSRLVHFFDADKNARDVARVLRVAGFNHLKDPNDPFMIRVVYGPFRDRTYAESQMFEAFPPLPEDAPKVSKPSRAEFSGDNFFDQVYSLDQREALSRLSGDSSVGGELYTFRLGSGGKHNILVDGKGTSCWIDHNGKIGSRDGGGPTVIQWLEWLKMSKGEAAKVVKRLFPELTNA